MTVDRKWYHPPLTLDKPSYWWGVAMGLFFSIFIWIFVSEVQDAGGLKEWFWG